MDHKVCEGEGYEKVEIPERGFRAVILRSLGDLCRVRVNLSEMGSYLLVGLYPLLKGGTEWSPGKLFQDITQDPELSSLIKNRPTLIHHLETLTKAGILRKGVEAKAQYALQEPLPPGLQLLDQVLCNRKFKDIFEENYMILQALTCLMARLIRPVLPEEPTDAIFALSDLLLHAGAQLATKELLPSQVLERQCADCIFPCVHEPQAAPDQPLDAQIKQFIGLKPAGVQEYEIFDFFELLDHPEAEITQVLQDLISRGEVDLSAGRYILPP